jgi:hypothetical protein
VVDPVDRAPVLERRGPPSAQARVCDSLSSVHVNNASNPSLGVAHIHNVQPIESLMHVSHALRDLFQVRIRYQDVHRIREQLAARAPAAAAAADVQCSTATCAPASASA